MKRVITVLALVAGLLVGCGDTRPKADTTLYGYIAILAGGSAEIVLLQNGGAETELLIGEDVELVGVMNERGQAGWSFDHVHRIDGVLNWAPDELLDENGDLKKVRVLGAGDWLWVTRVERLSEEEGDALIASGAVAAKEPVSPGFHH